MDPRHGKSPLPSDDYASDGKRKDFRFPVFQSTITDGQVSISGFTEKHPSQSMHQGTYT